MEEISELTLPMHVHSWYGVNAVVRAAGSLECDLVVEGIAFPHPSLVNLFIRHGLPSDARLRLSVWHEVGHLQTLPFAALLALALLAVIVRKPRGLLRRTLATLIGIQTAWELASEASVILKVGTRAYHRAYAKPNPRTRLSLFWIASVLATIAAARYVVLR